MAQSRPSFTAAMLGSTLLVMARRFVLNAARLVLRRPLHWRDNRIFWALLAHQSGLRRIGYVTHRPAEGEGAGAQALSMLIARSLADRIGVPYAHTPFDRLQHVEGDPAAFAQQWEDLLGLGIGEISPADTAAPGLDTELLFCSDVYNRRVVQHLFDGISDMVPDLRKRYYRSHTPVTNPRVAVAIHVRRGDVTPHQNSYMWTPLGEVRQTIATISACLEKRGMPFDLTVISQGTPADFEELAGIDCQLILDEPAAQSFARMVEADVLVMAKSSYSYLAALLCDGLVLYPDCNYPPQRNWLRLGQGLDAGQLEARLRQPV